MAGRNLLLHANAKVAKIRILGYQKREMELVQRENDTLNRGSALTSPQNQSDREKDVREICYSVASGDGEAAILQR
jgi:hypothetical protein